MAYSMTEADRATFAALGIGAELLERARVERVDDRTAREKYGINGHGDRAGIIFPYSDPLTGVRHTARLRRDHPDIENGKETKKYLAPYGDKRHLYFVPGCGELVQDADVPIVLVEAEKSALALTAWAARTGRKLLPVAMGGCWGWRGRIGKLENSNGTRVDEVGPLPELNICSNGRKTYVLLDANASTNVKVQQARSALAQILRKQRADVRILELPTADGVNGPDDYIAVCGDDAMAALFAGAEAGAAILDDVATFIRRFVVLSDAQVVAVTLWCAHSYAFLVAVWTAYLAVTSAAKRSGKSRLLEVVSYIVRRPWWTSGASAASLFREIDQKQPTLLLDEMDALFKGDPETAQAIRGVLNAGAHHKGVVSRCIGQGTNIVTKSFRVFCPKALAGIGSLPDTILDRSLPIRLQRKMPAEKVERLRERSIDGEASALRDRLAKWLDQQRSDLRNAEPELPAVLNDRQQDGAEILLAIADLAGGAWPDKARTALVELYTSSTADDEDIAVRLLVDIRGIFDANGTDRMSSADLVAKLADIETSPWAEWGKQNKPIGKTGLGRLLSKKYDIRPRTVRDGALTFKGYELTWFKDAFSRYLPSETSQASQSSIDAGSSDFSKASQDVSVTDIKSEFSPTAERVVTDVTLQNPGTGQEEARGCFIHGRTDCTKCRPTFPAAGLIEVEL